MGCKLQEPLKTHGIIFLENRAAKLTINQSNKNDTVKILGQPQVKSDEASDSWIYVERILSKGKYHKLGKHVMKENNVLVLHFNKFGILEAKEYYDKDDINSLCASIGRCPLDNARKRRCTLIWRSHLGSAT